MSAFLPISPIFATLRSRSSRNTPRCCAPTPPGETLVHAALTGNLPLLLQTISQTSPSYASTRNNSRMTALMWAAAEGHIDIAQELLTAGADPNSKSSTGHTALLFAYENIPRTVMRQMPAGYPGRKGEQPKQLFGTPRKTSHESIAKMLVASGADVRMLTEYNETLLHLAARKGLDRWISILSPPLDVNHRSIGYNHTALHVAAREGHADVIAELIRCGAEIDGWSTYGWTPLIWACACGNVDAVRKLVDAGADVNCSTEKDKGMEVTTPLREARKVDEGRAIVKILKDAGARY